VVGGAKTAAGINRALRMRIGDTTAQDLGSLPGLAHSSAYAVNLAGDVVGVASAAANLYGASAEPWVFRNTTSQMINLDPFHYGVYAAATGINDGGWVAGTNSFRGTGTVESFKWKTGNPINLDDFSGDQCHISYAMSINTRGTVVGYSAAVGACGDNRAVSYNSAGNITDLGTLGGTNAQAQAVNYFGDVVGVSELSTGQNRATLWSNGVASNLGTLGGASFAMGINDEGIIIGYFLDNRNQQRACVWRGGQIFDLNTLLNSSGLGWRLLIATGVNSSGQIVGQGRDAQGRLRGFILTPPCRSDYNRDGGIDGSDVSSFFDSWSAGLPDTDLNLDGGVDFGDVGMFFDLWSNGRC
jgi:hypothetical protein